MNTSIILDESLSDVNINATNYELGFLQTQKDLVSYYKKKKFIVISMIVNHNFLGDYY